MLAACGHKFGECSTDVHILRLCECHLAVANCLSLEKSKYGFLSMSGKESVANEKRTRYRGNELRFISYKL